MRIAIAFILSVGLLAQAWIPATAPAAYAEPNPDTQDLLKDLFGNPKQNEPQQPAAPGGGEKRETPEVNAPAPEGAKPSPKPTRSRRIVENDYSAAQEEWKSQGIEVSTGFRAEIHPRDFLVEGKLAALTTQQETAGYSEPVYNWEDSPEVRFHVNVPKDGLYRIQIDYFAKSDSIVPTERGLKVNGEFPFYESRRFVLSKTWKSKTAGFEEDDMGNQLFPMQIAERKWQSAYLTDASYLHDEPLLFRLKQGDNEITLLQLREPILLGKITVDSPTVAPSYEEYLKSQPQVPQTPSLLYEWEAELPEVKSNPAVQPVASGEVGVTPYRSGQVTLNTIGGASWKEGGQSVTWKFAVEETGYYQIAFKYTQYFKINMPVFRSVLIDGKVPFRELNRYKLAYAPRWKNEILSGAEGEPYRFYLKEGEHSLTMIANSAPYEPVIRSVKEVMGELNELYLDIKMATGNTLDIYRDWDMEAQMPDLPDRMRVMAGKLRAQYDYLSELSGTKPDQARNLAIGADQLEKLAEKPNEVPVRFKQLAQGSGSITQKLGDLLLVLPDQSLQIDKFYAYSNKELPKAEAGFFQRFSAMLVNFFSSFTKDYTKISSSDEETLQVWVSRPRQYVTLMQQLANQNFTKNTGIKVSLSLMPSEQKLILANAAGTSPDVALGIDTKLPYELSLRGALTDLGTFGDYKQVASRFSPGAMIPFQFDQGSYALPETQNFLVLFYRKDILDALGLKVPDTWDDVIGMLPALQRYGMNFYVPLSGGAATKGLGVTAPFFNQQGAELFAPNGLKTALDSEKALDGFKLMTKLFTTYNMPLQVPSFYNHFREGSLPIGISDYASYVELTAAAPELAGWWKIAPYPGVKDASGKVSRWAPGTGKADVIFKSSAKQDKAWEFMKWWTSAETQREFGTMVETIYGPSFKWNTSNLDAFAQMPWPKDDLKVIQEQWKWLKDIPHVPGDYMLDREISNAWNKVVFDGVNVRKALEDAVILANREMLKKLEEFGYVQDGKVVKEIRVPAVTESGLTGGAP